MVQKIDTSKISFTLFLLIAALFLIGFSFWNQLNGQKEKENNQLAQKVVDKIKQETNESTKFSDYDSLSNLKKIDLLGNEKPFKSWTPNSYLDQNMVRTSIVLNKGELAKGYFYIEASIDGKSLTQWESVYVKMNNWGGHIFRPQSLPLPQNENTRLLFALNNVPYLTVFPYNENATPVSANWFSLFADGNKVEIDTFISSLRPAFINEMDIYYQCTKESDCLLTIVK